MKHYLLITIFIFGSGIVTTGCKKEKDEKLLEMEGKLESLKKASGHSVEELELVGIELDEILRSCSTKNTKSGESAERIAKKITDCRLKGKKELLNRNNILPEFESDLIMLYAYFKWELKHFVKKNRVDVGGLQKIYAACMNAMVKCKEGGDKKIQISEKAALACAEQKCFQTCAESKFDASDCGKIVSMGVDYGWDMIEDRKSILINPAGPVN